MAGSTNIDEKVQQHVRDLFGPEDFDSWMLQHPQMFSKIKHKAWEVAKKNFDDTRGIALDIPGRMVNSLPDGVRHLNSFDTHMSQHVLADTCASKDSSVLSILL